MSDKNRDIDGAGERNRDRGRQGRREEEIEMHVCWQFRRECFFFPQSSCILRKIYPENS